MKIKLYEIDKMYDECIEKALDTETGEVKDIELFNFLEEIEEVKEKKLLNIACLYKSYIAESEAYKNEKNRLYAKEKSAKNKAENLKKFLIFNLTEKENIKDARASLSWRKSESVKIDVVPEMLLDEYQKIKIDADKTKIKKDIKNGVVVPDCSLATNYNLQIK